MMKKAPNNDARNRKQANQQAQLLLLIGKPNIYLTGELSLSQTFVYIQILPEFRGITNVVLTKSLVSNTNSKLLKLSVPTTYVSFFYCYFVGRRRNFLVNFLVVIVMTDGLTLLQRDRTSLSTESIGPSI